MSETPPQNAEEPAAEQPQEAPAPRRFLRSSSDRVVAGVAGGLARHLNIDPTLVRIGTVVGCIAFPPAAIGYILAVAFVAADDSPATGTDRNRIAAVVVAALLVLVLLPVVIPFGFLVGPPLVGILVPLALVGGVVWLVAKVLGDGPPSGRRIAAAAAMLVVAVGGFLAALAAAVFGGGWIVAVVVIVCGLGLAIGAFAGGARWLLAPALLLALPLAGVAAADVKLEGGVGERHHRPAAITDVREHYELGIGKLDIDLRHVDFPAGDTRVRVDLGIGEVVVRVPDDVCVAPVVHAGAGNVDLFGRDQGGLDLDVEETPRVRPSASRLVVDADVGMGEVRITTSPSDGDWFGLEDPGPPGPPTACRLAIR